MPTGGRQAPDHWLQKLSASTGGLHGNHVHEVLFGGVGGQIEDQINDPGTGVDDTMLCDVRELDGFHLGPDSRRQRLCSTHALTIVEFCERNVSASLRFSTRHTILSWALTRTRGLRWSRSGYPTARDRTSPIRSSARPMFSRELA